MLVKVLVGGAGVKVEVLVKVLEKVGVKVFVGVFVGLKVLVKVFVMVGVKVRVKVLVNVGELVKVRVKVGVEVEVKVDVLVGVKVLVGQGPIRAKSSKYMVPEPAAAPGKISKSISQTEAWLNPPGKVKALRGTVTCCQVVVTPLGK